MDLFHILAEEKIKQAYKDGEFDHLPGMGKPLKPDDMSGVPEELRMAYRIMKNAGYTEEEKVLRKELMTIEDLLNLPRLKSQDSSVLTDVKTLLKTTKPVGFLLH